MVVEILDDGRVLRVLETLACRTWSCLAPARLCPALLVFSASKSPTLFIKTQSFPGHPIYFSSSSSSTIQNYHPPHPLNKPSDLYAQQSCHSTLHNRPIYYFQYPFNFPSCLCSDAHPQCRPPKSHSPSTYKTLLRHHQTLDHTCALCTSTRSDRWRPCLFGTHQNVGRAATFTAERHPCRMVCRVRALARTSILTLEGLGENSKVSEKIISTKTSNVRRENMTSWKTEMMTRGSVAKYFIFTQNQSGDQEGHPALHLRSGSVHDDPTRRLVTRSSLQPLRNRMEAQRLEMLTFEPQFGRS